jgi:hypothetical protein
MRRSLATFSESEASNHTTSLADFTTTTPELKFSAHTSLTLMALGRRENDYASLAALFTDDLIRQFVGARPNHFSSQKFAARRRVHPCPEGSETDASAIAVFSIDHSAIIDSAFGAGRSRDLGPFELGRIGVLKLAPQASRQKCPVGGGQVSKFSIGSWREGGFVSVWLPVSLAVAKRGAQRHDPQNSHVRFDSPDPGLSKRTRRSKASQKPCEELSQFAA